MSTHIDSSNNCWDSVTSKSGDDHKSETWMTYYSAQGQQVANYDWHLEVFNQMSSDPCGKPQQIK